MGMDEDKVVRVTLFQIYVVWLGKGVFRSFPMHIYAIIKSYFLDLHMFVRCENVYISQNYIKIPRFQNSISK